MKRIARSLPGITLLVLLAVAGPTRAAAAPVPVGVTAIQDGDDADAAGGPQFLGAPIITAALRGLGVGALMGSAGLLALLAWLLPTGGAAPRRAATLFAWVAVAFLVLHAGSWLLDASFDRTFDADTLAILTGTAPGRTEIIRITLALGVALTATLRRGPAAPAVLALLGLVASAYVGHAASIATLWSFPAKVVHLGAGAVWLGGLLWLLLADPGLPEHRRGVERVSAAALAAVILVTLSGFTAALLFLPAFRDLFHSDYGTVALAKTAGVAILVGFGAYHRFVLVPGTADAVVATKLRRSVRYEVAVMVIVVLLGGLLAYVSPPEAGG